MMGMTAKDLMMGVLSTNIRAGVGLYVVDKVMEGLSEYGDWNKLKKTLTELSGEAVGGLLTPLQTITDVVKEFDRNPQVARDRREEPFWGPIKSKIPGMEQTMPVMPSPLRAEPAERLHPGIRQLTGASIREPKNAIESEVDRLGLPWQKILPKSQYPALDREIAARMGPILERESPVLLNHPGWSKIKPEFQRLAVAGLIMNARHRAIASLPDEMKGKREELAKLGHVPVELRNLFHVFDLEQAIMEKK
jgi:hypothetical protein